MTRTDSTTSIATTVSPRPRGQGISFDYRRKCHSNLARPNSFLNAELMELPLHCADDLRPSRSARLLPACSGAVAVFIVNGGDLLDGRTPTEQAIVTVHSSAQTFSDSHALAPNTGTGETIGAPRADLRRPPPGEFPPS